MSLILDEEVATRWRRPVYKNRLLQKPKRFAR